MIRVILAVVAAAAAAPAFAQTSYPPAVAPVCDAVPAPDTLGGAVGSGPPCTPREDASRPTQVQALDVVTDGNGNWTVTWPRPFATGPMMVVATVRSTTSPYICQPGAITSIGATGRCWQLTPSSLPATVTALPGLVVSPFVNAAGNVPVLVFGRQ